MPREKIQVATTTRSKVPMHRIGADCTVVVMKRGNARGAKGAGHRRWIGSTGNGRSPIISGRRQPSCDGTSRMNRETHVRICERLGVKFLGPTRQMTEVAAPTMHHRNWYRLNIGAANGTCRSLVNTGSADARGGRALHITDIYLADAVSAPANPTHVRVVDPKRTTSRLPGCVPAFL